MASLAAGVFGSARMKMMAARPSNAARFVTRRACGIGCELDARLKSENLVMRAALFIARAKQLTSIAVRDKALTERFLFGAAAKAAQHHFVRGDAQNGR